MRLKISPAQAVILILIALLMCTVLGILTIRAIPSRYLLYMPSFVQNIAVPEPESAFLPTISAPVDADELLGASSESEQESAESQALAIVPTVPALNAVTPQPTPTLVPDVPTRTPTPLPTIPPTPVPGITPSATPPPLPAFVRLSNITYQQQDWNNCGPATLAMGLSVLGLQISQYDAAAILKPDREDRNVTPTEMRDYVNNHTQLRAINRVNGSLDTLRRLLANDFPVILEVGDRALTEVAWVDSEPNVAYRDWWGHYLLAAGYDDGLQEFWVYNSLIWDVATETNTSNGHAYSYEELHTFWPQFNRSYIVIYEPHREAEVAEILGEDFDLVTMWERSLQTAQLELLNNDSDAFRWFNLGSSFNSLGRHDEAATAFDKARELELPWRMLWYQFGPYEAYFHTGRYNDIVLLADATLKNRPYFEESFYWRGQAQQALGNTFAARSDFQSASEFNPYFTPASDALALLNE